MLHWDSDVCDVQHTHRAIAGAPSTPFECCSQTAYECLPAACLQRWCTVDQGACPFCLESEPWLRRLSLMIQHLAWSSSPRGSWRKAVGILCGIESPSMFIWEILKNVLASRMNYICETVSDGESTVRCQMVPAAPAPLQSGPQNLLKITLSGKPCADVSRARWSWATWPGLFVAASSFSSNTSWWVCCFRSPLSSSRRAAVSFALHFWWQRQLGAIGVLSSTKRYRCVAVSLRRVSDHVVYVSLIVLWMLLSIWYTNPGAFRLYCPLRVSFTIFFLACMHFDSHTDRFQIWALPYSDGFSGFHLPSWLALHTCCLCSFWYVSFDLALVLEISCKPSIQFFGTTIFLSLFVIDLLDMLCRLFPSSVSHWLTCTGGCAPWSCIRLSSMTWKTAWHTTAPCQCMDEPSYLFVVWLLVFIYLSFYNAACYKSNDCHYICDCYRFGCTKWLRCWNLTNIGTQQSELEISENQTYDEANGWKSICKCRWRWAVRSDVFS